MAWVRKSLALEHRRAELANREPTSRELELIDAIERWINSQHLIFLTDVNVGSWTGISTRKMAEEAGCLDFYNYVYTPFSACTHSMWHHVGRYNLKECQNPLHQFHAIPHIPDLPIDPYYMSARGKIFAESLCYFRRSHWYFYQRPVGLRFDL